MVLNIKAVRFNAILVQAQQKLSPDIACLTPKEIDYISGGSTIIGHDSRPLNPHGGHDL